MTLINKNSTPHGGFVFFFKAPSGGEEIRVPGGSKSANGLPQLGNLVGSAFRNNKMQVPGNLLVQIEHQICLRQQNPNKVCYSGGIGDDLHHKVAKPLLKKVAKVARKLGARGVAAKADRVAGCSGCGGTKTYVEGKNNLGRAGKLNSAKFALNADHKR